MNRAVLLYDRDCGFCRWSTARILAWDRGLVRAVALQHPEARRLLPEMDPSRKMASWHLVTPGARVRSGGAAIAPLARLLPGGAPIAFLAEVFPGLTERAYRWTAKHRDGLGRLLGERACSVEPGASAAGR
ncbi:MAG: thiol-disulfide oxidoreductase DCC family protein [Actinomycetota bacterium]